MRVRPRPKPVRQMFASWRSKITCPSSSCIGWRMAHGDLPVFAMSPRWSKPSRPISIGRSAWRRHSRRMGLRHDHARASALGMPSRHDAAARASWSPRMVRARGSTQMGGALSRAFQERRGEPLAKHPGEFILHWLRVRWPTPVEALIEGRLPVNSPRRLPRQAALFARRLAKGSIEYLSSTLQSLR